MAVIVKYVVVRDGDEKMTFATKKEADAHDKMLDIADNLYRFLEMEEMGLDDVQLDALSLRLAQKKDVVLQLLKGGKLSPKGKEAPLSGKSTSPPGKKKTRKASAAKKAPGDPDKPRADTEKKTIKSKSPAKSKTNPE